MENATQALYMAFAVFVFIVAITVSFVSFANVREVSDVILHRSDKTYFADYDISNGESGRSRVVGLETIIPTLHKYYKENYTVVFKEATTFKAKTGEFTPTWNYKEVYTTNNNNNYRNFVANIKDNYNDLMEKKYYIYNPKFLNSNYVFNERNIKIFSFDSEEEQLRNEPWTTSEEEYKKNVDAFLQGGEYINPRNGSIYNEYDNFINEYGNSIWIESIGEYIKDTTTNSLATSNSNEDKEKISDYTQQTLGNESVRNSKKKRIIIFTKVTNIEE